jgi:hypothetical protein
VIALVDIDRNDGNPAAIIEIIDYNWPSGRAYKVKFVGKRAWPRSVSLSTMLPSRSAPAVPF